MGDITGFMKYPRQELPKEAVDLRKKHWREFWSFLEEEEIRKQAGRCMDCGIPFCHWGCPIANLIPEWNDLIFRGRWEEAIIRLHATNNFPEITGRVCPAPCEHSCVLGINKPAVSIKNHELMIAERAFEKGWIRPRPLKARSGKTVAVIGSGPAGLACADQLNRAGHLVTVFEKNEVLGGILALGIPDFKLEKGILERRLNILEEEGIVFKTGVQVGVDVMAKALQREFDALVLSGGAEQPRDLQVPGRELGGVRQAMEYLMQQNRINHGQAVPKEKRITAQGKHVIILGGGDTGADCVGTANRQGARSVRQFEILPKPPLERRADNPWPQWAFTYRCSTSHEEGVEQDFSVLTKNLSGEKGKVKQLHAVRLEYGPIDSKTCRYQTKEIAGSEFTIPCDLLILAMGFLGPVRDGMLDDLGVELDGRGNVKTDENYMTNVSGVFAAGDMRRGQSLVVWAIQEGRAAARGVQRWLLKG
jgi:glutamate synthase (NADPH) small chain